MQLRHFEAAQVTVGERWGKRRAREPASTRLYWQVRGHALLEVGGRRIQLTSGDLALLPRGDAHVIRDRIDSHASSTGCPGMHRVDEHVYEAYPAGRSQLVVAVAEHATPCPSLELLPAVVTLSAEGKPRWMRDTLAALASVSALPAPSRVEVAQSLLRVLFDHALETRAPEDPGDAALSRLASVLAGVRAAPHAHWELGTLARRAGMSRTVFAERIVSLLGMPLGQYIRALRVERARELLHKTDIAVKQVAARVGYANDAAFARAFVRAVGESPSRFRARARGMD